MATAQRIAVLGAGLMGHGIALSFARFGHRVQVYDTFPESLATLDERVRASLAALGLGPTDRDHAAIRITGTQDLQACVSRADVVFEAAPEKLELKQQLFAAIEPLAPGHAIFASNTSVIPITNVMSLLRDKSRALGTHWWNPPHLIPLVEVIRTQWTSEQAIAAMLALLTGVGKSPVRVEKDVPGFIGNRLQHALWREAISLVENGVCDAEAVDSVIKASFGRRLAVLGPLENADLVGTDLTLDIHNTILADLESRRGPSPYLEQLVADGKLGMKSGQGFRTWSQTSADTVRRRVSSHLRKLDAILDD
ncbi:MAG: 3-hydroxyacyl-CoA dehydrogenase family protein [Rhodocyclaceae bacterium]|nr:3-hydroxyacyl-CoA dehydrogenase family protein [Rhodocyclaceae bacterium]